MNPRLDALPPPQRRLWPELRATPRRFVLYGGTAIALRLAHRESEDFDFFSSDPFDGDALLAEIPYLRDGKVVQRAEDTLTCVVDRRGPVRMSFFGGLSLNRVRSPQPAEGAGILVASLQDLGGTKAQVVQTRALAKDYIDVDALMRLGRVPLAAMLGAAAAIHGERHNAMLTLKALTYFGDGDLPDLPAAVRERLTHAATTLNVASIPRYEALPGLGPSSPRE
ncbi:MAG: nucleotidyl transferase AbiEii/AbiGii toxin family protein [Gemmatimonadetes bacterium]|nr:nucleotidyl transferase AbiEii/AbiGii toxin family protein [Gemmatimonadota bacterium]MYE69317.1 nucleotidyl transferase AbiEii/AbiGii toxin family protein [Gemmatimonadota bacterium]MYJ68840.1 nucleotidyl transferase AbiEii/AbiGii toxin family protein [Gemmatimonadota bacterium]